MRRIWYEWAIESLEYYEGCGEDPDITNLHFEDKLSDLPPLDTNERLVLVRREADVYGTKGFENVEGLEILYAYLVDNKLPNMFEESCVLIPQKFHKELAKLNTLRVCAGKNASGRARTQTRA